MNFSFWETDSWFSNIDYCIVGSGITGLNAALRLKQAEPGSRVLILEKGMLPEGASTKNAGFACFGSISEILDDLKTHSPQEVVELVQKRKRGLELLRKNLGDDVIDYQEKGGYELFTEADKELYEECLQRIPQINELLQPVFREDVFEVAENKFGFRKIQPKLVFNKFEGQIDTGKMMSALVKKAIEKGIRILNGVEVRSFEQSKNGVNINTPGFSIKAQKLIIATNGFASRLGIDEVKPARAQVLVTKPIQNLPFEGTFHLDKGYYYFRNIGDRVLFGGGRNLDFKTEETDETGLTDLIQNKLRELLETCILPETEFEIQQSWSGIMGVGAQKKPIIKELSKNVFCGVRLGGMGIAIGSLIGKEIAELAIRS
ncbi:FAD-dependent oxidoreductase [Pontixanthobacter gangjinensis]|uniref:FAD-binding oxidoreductase n=1 Tax=Christiangramia aestuarii TaxID=1028746 RepID=A0A7K1LSF3_9FLAO|nr:FAD-dependent oxidoreductase [Christiangramia aestuarii]MUP43420.1 FAD-binding oxidoreductase [Christiangramia aestuarii]